MTDRQAVRAWEETVPIPTYSAPAPDLNPMFLEKRVYQGSSGKVYPCPFTDRVSGARQDRPYRAVFLENEYIRLMMLPELGGRIHIGLDKTNGYDFFYRQNVIKPALVGLLGPWISGGVEFNWPQHHRPSTFMPAEYAIEEHPGGSRTVWLSEHDPMCRMKGMVGICLHPGKAYVEAKVQLYNRTPFPQTFLWWANVGVRVHDEYQAFFPPDVTFVADHARRAMTEFPLSRSVYYGVDYSKGVDIRWYRNIPVPTSYMVTESKYGFFGGYDHRRKAGLVHYANRHVSPGKKLWTWGNHEFGYAWDRELTDADGPYVELMAGVYTDNQPDFSWLQPYETKTFRHYWYPIQEIGPAKNANRRAAVSLETEDGRARIGVCVTEAFADATVLLTANGCTVLEARANLRPGNPFTATAETAASELLLRVCDSGGRELIRYAPDHCERKAPPGPATEPPAPRDIASTETLYLTGLHLEQYRHATRYPEPYWEEALRREPGDVRSNTALGLLKMRRGLFAEAEQHFRGAVETLTRRNPNPYDGEPYYQLGLALKYQGRLDEAYAALYKSAWNYAWQSPAYYALAEIDCLRGDFETALEHLDRSLQVNALHTKARNLKAAVLRRLGRDEEAREVDEGTLALDPLDAWARLPQVPDQAALDVAFDLAAAGFWNEAACAVERAATPALLYPLACFLERAGEEARAKQTYIRAANAAPDYYFPSRIEEIAVLERAMCANPGDARAPYYLGNVFYDKKRYDEAIRNWEIAARRDPSFATPWRNLGMAYYNVRRLPERAVACYAKAFAANPSDARLLYEYDQLRKRLGVPPRERLAMLEHLMGLVERRDDFYVELVTLCNQAGQSERALELLGRRRFHPWEGGEGKVSGQYVAAHLILGRAALAGSYGEEALRHFEAALCYPENLGEGKHLLTPENGIHFFRGLALEQLGRDDEARAAFELAAAGPEPYWQALAKRKLGDADAASEIVRKMHENASQMALKCAKIDYFATSLPNFLLFEDDLQKTNDVECAYQLGLACAASGDRARAEEHFRRALELDPNHLNAQQELHAGI